MKIKRIFPALLLLAIVGAPVLATTPTSPVEPIPATTSLETIVTNVTNWVFYIFFAVAIIFLVFAAFSYLTAGGDPTKTATAHTRLTYSIAAIAVALLAKAIPVIVKAFLV